jgi:hypothetical protein
MNNHIKAFERVREAAGCVHLKLRNRKKNGAVISQFQKYCGDENTHPAMTTTNNILPPGVCTA